MDHSVDRFIESIRVEAFDSAAVNHPYLSAMNRGELPNIELALKDFAFQYGLYSAGFTGYVTAVINNLSSPEHQRILLANLAEEHGDAGAVDLPSDVLASIAGLPHTSLYQRFQLAVGVDAQYLLTAQQCSTSVGWREQFMTLCTENEYVGVGAIGIGTELIVSRIYEQILGGLERHSTLTATERVFFDLHSQCDDEHADQILLIARDLARDGTHRKQIAHGARQAIEMRVSFWDTMLERAHHFPASEASNTRHRGTG